MSTPSETKRPKTLGVDHRNPDRTAHPSTDRRLAAILNADVVGYSRLMGEDELDTVRTLDAYYEIAAALIAQHQGRVVNVAGDNLLAEFASVVDAVQCALEIQHALREKNAKRPSHRRMELRIGINVGDVLVERGQIYGDGVNVAARMEELAETGGICISGTAFDQIENKLALPCVYLGEQMVKNIAQPVRVYRVQAEPQGKEKALYNQQEQAICFSLFRLDVINACLWRGKKRIALTPKDFAVFHSLVTHSGQLVTHEELFKTVWPDTHVSHGVLKVCLRRIRQALGDQSTKPRFIETVHRRGYRFIAPLTTTQPVPSSQFSVPSSPPVLSSQPLTSTVVGREAELAQLHKLLEKALEGKRQMVFITGEPGIGKTAVAEAFLTQLGARGWELGTGDQKRQKTEGKNFRLSIPIPNTQPPISSLWIGRGQCVEHYGPGEAYLPVLEALGRLCRAPGGEQLVDWMKEHAPTWLVQMPTLLNTGILAALQSKLQDATRERMLREMMEGIEVLTTTMRPFVLVLEDLQWSDHSTVELLTALARRQDPARLLVLGTYRPDELLEKQHPLHEVVQELRVHGLGVELGLELLNETEVAAYLRNRFPRNSFPTSLVQLLYQRTEGIPLFLTNVVDDFIAQGVIGQSNDEWTLQSSVEAIEREIPESIRLLVAKQSARLLPMEQQLLQAASVTGMDFSAAAVAAALEADVAEVEEWCAGLAARQRFLRRMGISQWPDGTLTERYGFIHALYQHLWHERVGLGRRHQWHLRIGSRQELAYGDHAHEIASELALHFEQGRDFGRAVRYRAQAAENALRRYAYQEAIVHLTRGVEFLNTLPETPERTRHELNLRGTLGIALQANRGWGNPEVEKAYTRARDLCQKVKEPTQLFLVFFGLFQFHLTRAEYKTAYELTEQLLSLAQSTRDPALLVQAHGAMGVASFFLGELTAARTQFEQSKEYYDSHRHRNHAMTYGQDPWVACQSSLAEVLWLLGYPDQALKRANESVAFAQELSHPFSLAFALYSAALVCQFRREASALQQQADVLLTLARQQRFPLWELGAQSLQGWVLADQGQGVAGVALIRQGSPERRATATAMRLPYHQARLAEAYEKSNQTEEGLAQIKKALTTAANTSERWWEPELYRLKGELTLKQFGVQSQDKSKPVKADQGKSGVRSPRPEVSSTQHPTPNTQSEAEECFHKAIELARRQSAKSLELRAVVSLSRLWQQQGKKKPAHKMLQEIYTWFTEGFDTIDLQEAKALLAALA